MNHISLKILDENFIFRKKEYKENFSVKFSGFGRQTQCQIPPCPVLIGNVDFRIGNNGGVRCIKAPCPGGRGGWTPPKEKDTDCEGGFTECDKSTCKKKYWITEPSSGDGKKCPHEDGQELDCDECYIQPEDCIYEYSGCKHINNKCVKQKIITRKEKYGGKCPGEEVISCNPGEGQCPRDCVGSFNNCQTIDGKCVKKFTVYEKELNKGKKCIHEDGHIEECDSNDNGCDVNCEGQWSKCNDDCNKEYSIIKNKRNNGKKCDYAHGEIEKCNPGEDECPKPIDCEGVWNDCKYDDQLKKCRRKYNHIVKQSGGGDNCRIRDGFVEDCTDCEKPVSEPAPEPSPQPSPEPAPEPAPQPAPEPDPEPSPEPVPEPAPEPDTEPESVNEPVTEPEKESNIETVTNNNSMYILIGIILLVLLFIMFTGNSNMAVESNIPTDV